MSKPRLTAYGGVGEVTGANFLLEANGKKYLIDCGFLQGVDGADEHNKSFAYDPKEIDTLFVTHAHADHIGKIPKLVKDGFTGRIFSTEATKDLSLLMLLDNAHINQVTSQAQNMEPLYTDKDVTQAMNQWQTLEYHKARDMGDFTLELLDAGHILGSAMYRFTFALGSIVFTGDLGNANSPILPLPEDVVGAKYLLMESVYGDRNHEPKEERDQHFKEAIEEVIKKEGTLLIPIFSIERTQVILYELNSLFEKHNLPPVPVYLDSPLAIKVTEIYRKVGPRFFNQEARSEISEGDDIFRFPRLQEVVRSRDSQEIMNTKGAKIILAGSGMSTGGRIISHEMHYLPDPNATILLVGYQAPRTLGRAIESGVKVLNINNHSVELRAKVVKIEGFSAHMDSDHLVDFASKSKDTLAEVFVAMGETKSSEFLAKRLRDKGINAIVPERLKEYELDL